MNTKTFAQQSRNLLMDGVAKKLLYWGFDTKGEVLESPNKISGGYSFRGEVFDDPNVPQLWEALKTAVQQKEIEVVVEEAAYTWFNRMMAIRIMAKNGYDQTQLEYAEGLEHTPLILQKARQGQSSFLNPTEQQRLKKIIGDYSKDQEAFALLLVGYCHSNTMLKTVFGKIDDYTELLLPDNMLQDSGFLHLLNTTDAISDEEYKEVELIGWLYQFYISERKDEVFASFKKKKKAEAKDIPAATQIFTPNWIVKYMVENTAGKIWLDKHPESPIKANMKYLVENESDVSSSAVENSSIINTIEDLTLIDPACGSGHILVEGFDLLYQMYMEEYYTPEEAVESILTKNLFGLDIDDRAAQLATFAILLKAATKYRDVFTKGWLPNVYAMPEAQDFSLQNLKDFLGEEGQEYLEELDSALRLMKQAKNLGSVMKLILSEEARHYIQKRYSNLCNDDYLDLNLNSILQDLKNYIPILLILTNKYAAVVANPPYMGSANYNPDLKHYIDQNYKKSKADLYSVFFEVEFGLCIEKGCIGQVTMQTWMFIKSFSKIRTEIVEKKNILTLIDVGWNLFENHSYPTSVVCIQNEKHGASKAKFYNLTKTKTDRFKEDEFWKPENQYYLNQDKLKVLPENPIAYWASDSLLEVFEKSDVMENHYTIREGVKTGKNDQFIRFWFEVKQDNISIFNGTKYFPHSKGGGFRKWYGNTLDVLFYEDSGRILKKFKGSAVTGEEDFFSPYVTWSRITYNYTSFRYVDNGFIPNMAGLPAYPLDNNNSLFLLGLGNSVVGKYILQLINPTMNFPPGLVSKLPFISSELFKNSIVQRCIDQSQSDWISHEISWDFEQSPLLNKASKIVTACQIWEEDVTKEFFQLHANEEELNRIFIDIYGLQEELTPEVPLKDITILQEELNKKDMEALEDEFRANGADAIELPFDKTEVISQFISYAMGLFMGRYRLDKPGLNIAHPNPTAEELEGYTYNNAKVTIDDDAIIPLMGKNCNFPDDALQQFQQLLDTIWGHESRTENINFIQECLNKDLEKFLVKDFYKYHCSMYKKKPIYWLFASPKGAFQVLVYMHRMNAFTVEKIRANYLLEHIKNLRSEETVLLANESNLSTQEAKRLDQLRKDITECETYDLELKDIADQQIAFDLDDGVTVNYEKFKTVVAKIK